MKLDEIGFYTLSDHRALNISDSSPIQRAEILLTDRCNLKCIYCRGLKKEIQGDLNFKTICEYLYLLIEKGLVNIRFSGGEPTQYELLTKLIGICKTNNVKHIAISTNGTANIDYYKTLIDCGVNDFSISFDSCCSITQEKMAGGINIYDQLVYNIKKLSKLTYVSIGMVINESNIDSCVDSIIFLDSLNVSDIRVIPSAQYNKLLEIENDIPIHILNKYPILKYRFNNILKNRNVRGLCKTDSYKCGLVLDDIAIAGKYHYPCIIYLREGGSFIGEMNSSFKKQRKSWFENHNSFTDEICKRNCLDVCIDFNNKRATVL